MGAGNRLQAAVEKELQSVIRQEKRWQKRTRRESEPEWRRELEGRIPAGMSSALEKAFCKAFSLVFLRGGDILEKSYDKDGILEEYSIRDRAVRLKGGRRELRKLHAGAQQADLKNLAFTTVEGIALGVVGIGIPDILLFIGTLLKGVYETVLRYGYGYESRREQMIILKMISASLNTGERREQLDREIDLWMMEENRIVSQEMLENQLWETARLFAADMLLLKVIQGIPVIGAVGGAANPVYYRKVLRYVGMKCRKGYLLKLRITLK